MICDVRHLRVFVKGGMALYIVEKIKTHILCSFTSFFFENFFVYGVMWKKYYRAGETTDDSSAHAHCMLDT